MAQVVLFEPKGKPDALLALRAGAQHHLRPAIEMDVAAGAGDQRAFGGVGTCGIEG
jgi:hypothetical protein